MSYLIKDQSVLQTLSYLAKVRNRTVIDVLREAVAHEADREKAKANTMSRLQPVLAKARAMSRTPRTPLDWQAEKHAADELWGE